MRFHRLLVLGLLFLTGCFGIELDVDSKGRLLVTREEGFFTVDPVKKEVKLVKKADAGTEPVYSRFSPNGKEILTVTKSDFQTFAFATVDVASGKSTQVLKVDGAAFTRYSPDGKHLFVVAASKNDDPGFMSKVPELHLVSLPGGKPKVIAKKIGTIPRWLPDSKQILVIEANTKIDDDSFAGNLSLLDVATGKLTPKAAILGKREYAMDVSPDGKKAVVTLLEAGKVGTKLEKNDSTAEALYEVNLSTGETKKLELAPPKYAFYSPNGKSLLMALPSEGFSFDTVSLEVADASDVSKRQKIAEAAYPLALGGEGIVHAGWVNDSQVYYFAQKKVYGIAGKNMQLMLGAVDGKKRQLLQAMIDQAAFE